MSSHSFIIAGFGGQGILYMGQILAYTANKSGNHVSWLPSYGPEMRGGTANCMLCISDKPISSPLIQTPNTLVVMNKPSLVRFEKSVIAGGCIILNKDLVDVPVSRSDVKVIEVAADSIALKLGNIKMANMVALGAIIGATALLGVEEVAEMIKEKMSSGKAVAISDNVSALKQGFELALKVKA